MSKKDEAQHRAWFTVDELNAWADKKLEENPQWAEQPAQQEPVAWMFQHEETGRTMCVDAQQVEWGFEKGNPRLKKIAPLYTSPPAQRKPLTDEQIDAIWDAVITPSNHIREFVRAIEATLREQNT
jgi:hypothetical protein